MSNLKPSAWLEQNQYKASNNNANITKHYSSVFAAKWLVYCAINASTNPKSN